MNCLDELVSMLPITLGSDSSKPTENAQNCWKMQFVGIFYFDTLHVCQQRAQRAPIAMGPYAQFEFPRCQMKCLDKLESMVPIPLGSPPPW